MTGQVQVKRSVPAGGQELSTFTPYPAPQRRHSNLGPWYAVGVVEDEWQKPDGKVETYSREVGFSLTTCSMPWSGDKLITAIWRAVYEGARVIGKQESAKIDAGEPHFQDRRQRCDNPQCCYCQPREVS